MNNKRDIKLKEKILINKIIKLSSRNDNKVKWGYRANYELAKQVPIYTIENLVL